MIVLSQWSQIQNVDSYWQLPRSRMLTATDNGPDPECWQLLTNGLTIVKQGIGLSYKLLEKIWKNINSVASPSMDPLLLMDVSIYVCMRMNVWMHVCVHVCMHAHVGYVSKYVSMHKCTILYLMNLTDFAFIAIIQKSSVTCIEVGPVKLM